MAAFQFVAIDAQGKEHKGVLEADTARQLRTQLREQGWMPIEVTPVISAGAKADQQALRPALRTRGGVLRRQRLSIKDLVVFTQQLAALLGAAMPIADALRACAEQNDRPAVKGVILGVRACVLEGHTLADGLKEFPSAFPPLYRATVAAGEQSGRLDAVLTRLAVFSEKQYFMRQKIRQALIYPIVMTFVSVSIVTFLLIYVVPRIVSVFSEAKQQLPLATDILLAASAGVKHYGVYIALALVLAVFLFRRLLKQHAFRYGYHRFLLRLPVLGNTLKAVNTARFARTLGILSAASVPVLEAMRVASDLITLLPIREATETATQRVREGTSIHRALQQTGYFPPMSVHLIASGEQSGRLEEMLTRAADTQDHEVAALIENALTLFEPMLILVMGAIVLFIVLAILLPIFTLEQLAG